MEFVALLVVAVVVVALGIALAPIILPLLGIALVLVAIVGLFYGVLAALRAVAEEFGLTRYVDRFSAWWDAQF